MTTLQKFIKYAAMAFALFLIVGIVGSIVSTVGIFGGFLGSDATGELTSYELSQSITSLEIEVNAADLTIKQGDHFALESNLKKLTVKQNGGSLKVTEKSTFGGNYNGALLILYVPANTVFDKADILTGAGRFTADALSAKTLELELGAGEVSIGSLSASLAADIDGGAGKITVGGGELHSLDLDMGVGKLELTAKLLGKSELDLGVGESKITLIGDEKDYCVSLEKGIGTLYVNGKAVSDYGSAGSGQSRVDISGGIGAVRLHFTE